MTSMCLKPGINDVSIRNDPTSNNSEIKLNASTDNKIVLSFTLTGMSRLVGPFNSIRRTFYLYIFLTYQNGGKEIEVISSSRIFCNEDILKEDTLKFYTSLDIPKSKVFNDEDFTWNFYSLNIAYSESEAEDGSDLNMLLNDPSNSLFNTKINFMIVGE